ncbi:MAG: metal ABC transporter solute-binding protein, Zn/Mn family [Candidatus Xenobium sp.]|jgi:zinc transport system substrate-binding protein|nr:zinc ABC transporter solute-binding protein [Burkholderiales bacterium]
MLRLPLLGALLSFLVLLGAGLGCSAPPPPQRPVVLCSVLPQAWFVERLAGERVQVEVMIPPGASPATYEPTVQQMQAASRASLYIKVGHPAFPFEATWLEPLLKQGQGLRQVDSSAGLERLEGDPHVWVSPGCVRIMARNIAQALEELLPAEREVLKANLQALLAEIDAVDRELQESLKDLRGTRFYAFHPAWGYLAREYGLEQVAIEEEGQEPSAGRLSEILEQARRDGVRVLFVQPQFSEASARVLAEDLGARVVPLDPLARDWPTTMRQVATAFRESL